MMNALKHIIFFFFPLMALIFILKFTIIKVLKYNCIAYQSYLEITILYNLGQQ